MKWFRVEAHVASEPVIAAVRHTFGDEGFGRLVLLWAAAARAGDVHQVGAILEDGRPPRLSDLAIALNIPEPGLRELVAFAAERGHVDPKAWRRGIIRFPFLANAADEYTKKVQRSRARDEVSGQGPDSVRTTSPRSDEKRSDQKRKRSRAAKQLGDRARASGGAPDHRPAAGLSPSSNGARSEGPTPATFRSLAAMVTRYRQAHPDDLEADVKDALKTELARQGLLSDPDTIRKALDATDPTNRPPRRRTRTSAG